MKMHQELLWLALPIMLLAADSVLAGPQKVGPNDGAPKNVTECGTVLTEPGNYKLANDLLDCPAAVDDSEPGGGVAILGSDISLNLNGHEISCADGQGDYAIVENNPWIDLFEAHWVDELGVLQPNPDGVCRNSWEKNQFQTEIGVADCIGPPVVLDEKDVCAVYDDD